jgi:hypothetical protein
LDNAVALTVRNKVGERRDGVVAGSLQDHTGRMAATFLLILLLPQYKYVFKAWEKLGDQM